MAKTNEGHNLGPVRDCVNRIEACLDRLASLKGEYMEECKGIRDEMKGIYADARDLGVVTQAVKTLVHTRILTRRIETAVEGLDPDDHDAYGAYLETLGAWGSTPLGQASRPTEEELEG